VNQVEVNEQHACRQRTQTEPGTIKLTTPGVLIAGLNPPLFGMNRFRESE
jgi:hypothetical protein